jgi:hypothetical protein
MADDDYDRSAGDDPYGDDDGSVPDEDAAVDTAADNPGSDSENTQVSDPTPEDRIVARVDPRGMPVTQFARLLEALDDVFPGCRLRPSDDGWCDVAVPT